MVTVIERGRAEILAAALDTAMSIAKTDLGNIQLVYPPAVLEIEVQHGFPERFLEFFERVSGRESACGSAFVQSRQVFVGDVVLHPIFSGTESEKVMLDAGARAVLSTPILDSSNTVLGMLSVHYHEPTPEQSVDFVAQRAVARRIAHLLTNEGLNCA